MNPAIADQPFVFQSPTASSDGQGTARTGTDSVGQTQREISEIVREVASVSRTSQPTERYFGFLVDRILRAMAAEGVVIWKREDGSTFEAIRRIGNQTDLQVPGDSVSTHARMLKEISDENQPVVVPSTPGANDPDAPANPTPFPCAVAPIEVVPFDTRATTAGNPPVYLIQVFLEPGGGVAAHRGYLRFVAQMADLAGEFLRSERMRQLQQHQIWIHQVDRWVAELHQLSNPVSVMERATDLVAEGFGFARVAWVRTQAGRRTSPKVIAVSHVDEIDAQGEAVRWLEACVLHHTQSDDSPQGSTWKRDSDVEGSVGETQVDAATASEAIPLDSQLQLEAVMPVPSTKELGIIDHLVLLSTSDSAGCEVGLREHVERAVGAIALVLDQTQRLYAMRSRRLGFLSANREKPWRWSWRWATLAALVLVVFCFPVPITVTASATLRPSGVQRVCSPRQAVVREVLVEHGDRVQMNQPLVTLEDNALNEQIASLLSRRAVLMEKKQAWTQTLVGANTRGSMDRQGSFDPTDADSQRQLIEAELRGVQNELNLLESARASLVILADRAGVVDAWQLRDRLRDRPVSRGEPLLNVVDEASPWYADAKVTQARIHRIVDAQQRGIVETIVYPLSDPSLRVPAAVDQVGPAVVNDQGNPQTLVRLALGEPGSGHSERDRRSQSFHEGAPLKVFVRSGRAPLGYLLFQDAVEWLRVRIGLYSSRVGDAG